MALTKKQKEKILDDLKESIAKQKAVLFLGISGLKVKDISELRKKIKAANGNLRVAKKTLIEKAFKENDLDFDKSKYKEELALVFGFEDEISPAKTIYQAGLGNENFKILGGFIGKNFNEAESIIALAQLPAKEELLAKLVGSMSASVSGFVRVLQGNIKGLITVLAKAKT